jgi:hypothetical protein
MAVTDPRASVPADWLAESIRATVFPAPGPHPNAEPWWRALIGEDPETRTVKPATREYLEEGPFEGGRLQLVVNSLGVIQWQLQQQPMKELPAGLLNIGPLPDVTARFADLIERWLPMSPPATRIAFGLVAVLPVESSRGAYEALGRYLRESVRIDPNGSSDFIYRINRPRPSTIVSGLVVNRLSTWSALRLAVLASSLRQDPGRVVHEAYGCRVELDINTVPTFQSQFDAVTGGQVFRELQDFALEIVRDGDIA